MSHEPGMSQTIQQRCEANVKLSEKYLERIKVGFDFFSFTLFSPLKKSEGEELGKKVNRDLVKRKRGL